jgi:hypothetical protein
MYFHEPDWTVEAPAPLTPGIGIALWSAALATLALGIFPSRILEFAGRSAILWR